MSTTEKNLDFNSLPPTSTITQDVLEKLRSKLALSKWHTTSCEKLSQHIKTGFLRLQEFQSKRDDEHCKSLIAEFSVMVKATISLSGWLTDCNTESNATMLFHPLTQQCEKFVQWQIELNSFLSMKASVAVEEQVINELPRLLHQNQLYHEDSCLSSVHDNQLTSSERPQNINTSLRSSAIWDPPPTANFLLDPKDITFEVRDGARHEIGAGSYGRVFLAKYRGAFAAVKMLNGDVSSKREAIENELKLVMHLKHKHVIHNHGYTITEKNELHIVMEYLPNRTLAKRIMGDNVQMNVIQINHICNQIISALMYLHSREIIHCDLSTANIMFDESDSVRVIDFGLAQTKESGRINSSRMGGMRFTAPEILHGETLSLKVDVYSFGVILVEMATNKQAHNSRIMDGNMRIRSIHEAIAGDKVSDPKLKHLIESCIKLDPEDRPSFVQINDYQESGKFNSDIASTTVSHVLAKFNELCQQAENSSPSQLRQLVITYLNQLEKCLNNKTSDLDVICSTLLLLQKLTGLPVCEAEETQRTAYDSLRLAFINTKIPTLLVHLIEYPSVKVLEAALDCLKKLTRTLIHVTSLLEHSNVVELLLKILSHGTINAKISATAVLVNLTVNSEPKLQETVSRSVTYPLLELLLIPDNTGRTYALRLLANLVIGAADTIIVKIAQRNVIDVLLELLREGSVLIRELVTSTLKAFSRLKTSRVLIRSSNGFPILYEQLIDEKKTNSEIARHDAALALCGLVQSFIEDNHALYQRFSVSADDIQPFLYILKSPLSTEPDKHYAVSNLLYMLRLARHYHHSKVCFARADIMVPCVVSLLETPVWKLESLEILIEMAMDIEVHAYFHIQVWNLIPMLLELALPGSRMSIYSKYCVSILYHLAVTEHFQYLIARGRSVRMTTIKFLVRLLLDGADDAVSAREHAAGTIRHLAKHRMNKSLLSPTIPSLVSALVSPSTDCIKIHAAFALSSLAEGAANQDAIGLSGAIPQLIHLLSSENDELKRAAVNAILALSFSNANRERILYCNGAQLLVQTANSRPNLRVQFSEHDSNDCLNILNNIKCHPLFKEKLQAAFDELYIAL